MATPWRTNNSFYRKYLYNYVLLYKNRADVKMFLEIILSLVTIIIFSLFAIRPTFVTIATLMTEIRSKEDISRHLDQKISSLSTAQELVANHQFQIDLLHMAIPSTPTPHTYVAQIEAIVGQNNATLELLRMENVTLVGEDPADINPIVEPGTDLPNTIILPPSADSIEITLSISGDYLSLLSVFKNIQAARRPFVVDSFAIGSITEANNERVVLNMTGRIPYIK